KVLASLQSQGSQGGGARATASQVNNARTAASGTSTGTIATNVQNVVNQTINAAVFTNVASSITQTVQTTANQSRTVQIVSELPKPETPKPEAPKPETPRPEIPNQPTQPQELVAFTGGLISSRNNYGPFGPIIAALGAGTVETDAQGQNKLAI